MQPRSTGKDQIEELNIVLSFFTETKIKKKLIEEYMKSIQPQYSKPLAAQVMPFTKFWEAEDYHQNYIDKNPSQGYVQHVSIPAIKKLQKEYPDMIKPDHIY